MPRYASKVTAVFSFAMIFAAFQTKAQDTGKTRRSSSDAELWQALKRELTGPDGLDYFDKYMMGAVLATLVGKLVSATPAERPTSLVLAMYGSDQAEVTLHLKGDRGVDTHMSGSLTIGSSISFVGIAVSFTPEPFMLTVDVSN
jgi:hypothetical protein